MDSSSAVDPVAAVVAALEGRQGTRWVGVDGKGATGKTTLAAQIAAALPGSVVVHIDDFARPDVQGWERDRFVRQVLQPLLAGRPGRYQRWDFDRNVGAEWHTVPVGVPVVVEGVSATDERLGCSVGLHDLGRGAVRGPAGASHGAGRSGADGPLADRLDAERGRVRRGAATSGPGRPRVPAAGCSLSLSKDQVAVR